MLALSVGLRNMSFTVKHFLWSCAIKQREFYAFVSHFVQTGIYMKYKFDMSNLIICLNLQLLILYK